MRPWYSRSPDRYVRGYMPAHDTSRVGVDANRRANWVMIHATNTAVKHDERMRAFYERALGRCGRRHAVAITHVANKMIRIIWHMLTVGTMYSSRNEALYDRKIKRVAEPARTARVIHLLPRRPPNDLTGAHATGLPCRQR